jgi:hypothetical protein
MQRDETLPVGDRRLNNRLGVRADIQPGIRVIQTATANRILTMLKAALDLWDITLDAIGFRVVTLIPGVTWSTCIVCWPETVLLTRGRLGLQPH